jgi:hypothetical protein
VEVIAVWLDGAMHFCTDTSGPKAKDLEHNRHCILTTAATRRPKASISCSGEPASSRWF